MYFKYLDVSSTGILWINVKLKVNSRQTKKYIDGSWEFGWIKSTIFVMHAQLLLKLLLFFFLILIMYLTLYSLFVIY